MPVCHRHIFIYKSTVIYYRVYGSRFRGLGERKLTKSKDGFVLIICEMNTNLMC